MTNNPFEQGQNSRWYPQLPDGYDGSERNRQERPVPPPTPGQPNYSSQQHWSPGYNQQHQNWSPGYNQPQQNWYPGYNPPQHNQYRGGFPFPFRNSFPGFPPWQGGGQSPGPTQPPSGNQAPQSPPPNWTPEYPDVQTFAVDPGAISRCMYRFTYVWLSRRQGFWFYPVFIGRTSVAGYRWNSRRRRWEYTGLDLANINSFTCI